MKVVELFTGIGSQAKALKRLSLRDNIKFTILKTCEWNIHAIVAYHLIHNNGVFSNSIDKLSRESLINLLSNFSLSLDGKAPLKKKTLNLFDMETLKAIYNSIIYNNNLVNIKEVTGDDIPDDTDILTYSFPCQDLSNVGSFHGYKNGIDRDKNTRSGLLWEVERILVEKKENSNRLPNFLILENVTALEAQRHNGNFVEWQKKLSELGYVNKVYKLNAIDFGIPQYRNRLIMISVQVGNSSTLKDKVDEFFLAHDLNDPVYLEKLRIKKIPLSKLLRTDYSNPTFLGEAITSQPNNTDSRNKIWVNNSKIIDEHFKLAKKVQTITTKQDRHPNSGNLYFDKGDTNKSSFRFLTPRECFLLMGFDELDYEKLAYSNLKNIRNGEFFTRDINYKLAGNSIVVNILEQVFSQIIAINKIITSSKFDNITSRHSIQHVIND